MGIKEKVLENDDELQKFIILLANAEGEPIKGRLKLQKMMFLLSDKIEEIKEQSSYDADNYGPYSEVIDEESQYLEQIGVLSSKRGEIAITKEGKEIAEEIMKNEDKRILTALSEYKKFLNDLTSKELLAYVYSAYPDMTEESIEYENLKPNMENYILALVKKEKISTQRAAELLNKSQDYIIKKIKERGKPDFKINFENFRCHNNNCNI